MPTPDVARALADGAARSRAAASRNGAPAAPVRPAWSPAAWFAGLPARRRKLIIGIGLFLLFDLIAGLAAVTMGTHF